MDLQMVYNALKSGLNECLWVPSYPLPTTETLTDLLTSNSWMADLDLGKHFLNFPLHEAIQRHCGMDLRPYLTPDTGEQAKTGTQNTMWLGCCRCMMGLKVSPYFTIKATHIAYEVVLGDPQDAQNDLQWDRIKLNLPGASNYTPQLPWVQRLCRDGSMAGNTPAYVGHL